MLDVVKNVNVSIVEIRWSLSNQQEKQK